MAAFQSNPPFIAANNAVTSAPPPEDRIEARKALVGVTLDLSSPNGTHAETRGEKDPKLLGAGCQSHSKPVFVNIH